MKIVYIAHPIGGNVVRNLEALAKVIRQINLAEPEVVPLAPYYADVLALDDNNPAKRARGLENGRCVLKSGAIREVWLYGDGVSPGMLGEIRLAEALGLPILPKTQGTKTAYNALLAGGALDTPVRGESCCIKSCDEPVYNLKYCFHHWNIANEDC
ncbi:hypothetical protein [Leeuwenhoekiella sp. ZYFB001]|uniref:DUF7768 domain-containing protein n=1 Tax=Leeuwenhoekiella sp. ZYFB001 TaxID=2719912 RepID=UPI001431B78C|nr:hypothetical protein [Leeuwenhoekiella sp. ZYFB001]